ncbi:IS110 family transposase [Deinococcus peraridilitoris]|uniref:IS110 family transposase n=1 Tax=Deinococcus peraridilitoris TaxID=432329 RepID=UPI003CCC446E
MEATGVSWGTCARTLPQAGCTISVENPVQIKFFFCSTLRRGKTDKMDAEIIAWYCGQLMQPKPGSSLWRLWKSSKSWSASEKRCCTPSRRSETICMP